MACMAACSTAVQRKSGWMKNSRASLSVCDLPFAMQLVSTVTSLDEISGNQLTQQYLYQRGVYAGRA